MAPQLWMLRHGEAVPHDSKPDHERELTPRGRRPAEAAGGALAAGNEGRVAEYSRATGFPRVDALALLEAHGADAKVLVVGHEPSFSQVVYDFTGARVDFKKGGIAGLRASRSAGELLVLE